MHVLRTLIIIACSYSQFTQKSRSIGQFQTSCFSWTDSVPLKRPRASGPELLGPWNKLDLDNPYRGFRGLKKNCWSQSMRRQWVQSKCLLCLLHVQNHFVRNEINKSKNYSFFLITNYISSSEYYRIHYQIMNLSKFFTAAKCLETCFSECSGASLLLWRDEFMFVLIVCESFIRSKSMNIYGS